METTTTTTLRNDAKSAIMLIQHQEEVFGKRCMTGPLYCTCSTATGLDVFCGLSAYCESEKAVLVDRPT